MTNFSISRETSTNHNLRRDVNRILNSWTIKGEGEWHFISIENAGLKKKTLEFIWY